MLDVVLTIHPIGMPIERDLPPFIAPITLIGVLMTIPLRPYIGEEYKLYANHERLHGCWLYKLRERGWVLWVLIYIDCKTK